MATVVGVAVGAVIILMADEATALLRQSPKATRALDWVFASVFSAFAVAGDVCTHAEVHIGAGEPGQFGDP